MNPINVVSYDELWTIRSYEDALSLACGSYSLTDLAKQVGYKSAGKLGEAIREGKGTLIAKGEITLQSLTRRPYIQCYKNKLLGFANISESDLKKLKDELEKVQQEKEALKAENEKLRQLLAQRVLQQV